MGNASGGVDTSERAGAQQPIPHAADAALPVARVPPTARDGNSTKSQYRPSASGAAVWWTCSADAEAPIQMAESGLGAVPQQTLLHYLKKAADTKGDKVALQVERPCPPFVKGERPPGHGDLAWTRWTWREYYDESKKVARAFIAAGLGPHDAVAIYGFNAPEWLMAALSAMMAGGVAAGVYPTDTAAQVKYKSEHSNAVVACVDSAKKAKMFVDLGLPKLRLVVVWGDDAVDGIGSSECSVVRWADCVAEACPLATEEAVDQRIAAQRAGQCCTYIYTSGTTGQPKAVMISHDNLCFITQTALHCLPMLGTDPAAPEERVISYLPLSHVAGMICDITVPIFLAANELGYCTVSFARQYDLKEGTIGDRLRGIRPTYFLGVPRVWEKIQEKMVATLRENPLPPMKAKIGRWAKAKGLEYSRNCQLGGNGAKPWFHGFADGKVFSVAKEKLGLDKCKFAFTGAAPISVDTLEYFGSLGININEAYGMSESTGATTWSTDSCHQWGSCGWALPGVEVKCFALAGAGADGVKREVPRAQELFPQNGVIPEDVQGEICFRGRHIMMGYMANRDLGDAHVAEIEKKNADAIDSEGWLHSGDKGCISVEGMVRITGRFKEIIIGAGGENIAPVPIEDMVKKLQPAVSNIMMVGDKRKFNVALVTLKAKGATGELPGGDELANEAAALVEGVSTVSGAAAAKAYTDAICAAIVAACKDGSVCPSNASKIQKFSILPRDFSVETGEFTPTLKLKRGAVEKQHAAFIDRMYESADAYVPYDGGDGGAAAPAAVI